MALTKHSHHQPTIPPIDAEVLLSRCLGDVSFALALLDELESLGIQYLNEIVLHTESDDALGAAQVAHSLKGATALIGAEPLRELSAQIEAAGRAGDSSRLPELVRNLRVEMDRCLYYLVTLRSDLQRGSSPAS